MAVGEQKYVYMYDALSGNHQKEVFNIINAVMNTNGFIERVDRDEYYQTNKMVLNRTLTRCDTLNTIPDEAANRVVIDNELLGVITNALLHAVSSPKVHVSFAIKYREVLDYVIEHWAGMGNFLKQTVGAKNIRIFWTNASDERNLPNPLTDEELTQNLKAFFIAHVLMIVFNELLKVKAIKDKEAILGKTVANSLGNFLAELEEMTVEQKEAVKNVIKMFGFDPTKATKLRGFIATLASE